MKLKIESNKKGGSSKNWIQKAVNPKHKGYCTPISKSTCTPRRKALAKRFKAIAKHENGGTIKIDGKTGAASNYLDQIVKQRDDFKGNILSFLTQGLIPSVRSLGQSSYSDLRKYYAGINPSGNYLYYSKYKPSNGNQTSRYIAINDSKIPNLMANIYNYLDDVESNGGNYDEAFKKYAKSKYGDNWENIYNNRKDKTKDLGPITKLSNNKWNIPRYYNFARSYKEKSSLGELGNYQVSIGEDNNGKYISYYDLWDTATPAEILKAGKAFEVYDRVYVKKDSNGKYIPVKQYGGSLDLIKDLCKKYKSGGKLSKEYIKEAREKPGGSNVGKYPMNQTFAGPSGGAPKGSYPIGDLKHAKSALKLAHNAPNPEGIKSAVYRKYPQLKKHKEGGTIDLSKILSIWKK